jgi:signal transduction histidine kinase
MFGAALLRSILLYYQIQDALVLSVGLLGLWLFLFLSQPAISRRWQPYFAIYLVFQSALTFRLLFNPEPSDFFALLYAILSAQIMRHFQPRIGTFIIALFTPLTLIPLLSNSSPPMAIALSLIYMAGNALLASYVLASQRARVARVQNQASLEELQQANRDLQAYSQQIQQLTVARERNRLARELHDSVTQSIFSMTLTTQSALLLLERDSSRVGEQLDRLNELAQSALAEMQTLISELSPEKITVGGLLATLRRHIAERRLPEGLSVSLEAEGSLALTPAEEQGLFRIAQESLNNIVKHAGASQANLQLHLDEPCWLEIRDNGQGFDLQQAQHGGGVGLSSMRERAAEIGWTLQVVTSPGSGTCIHLEKAKLEKHE